MHLLVSFLAKQPIPRLQHQPLGAVLAELANLVVVDHAEGFELKGSKCPIGAGVSRKGDEGHDDQRFNPGDPP